MRIEESINICRRPEEVFAFFDDRRNDSRWMDTVVSSRWVDDGQETKLGRRGRMLMHAPWLTEFEDARATLVFEPERLPGGPISLLVAPFLARSVRRNYRGDLSRLKQLLEAAPEENQ